MNTEKAKEEIARQTIADFGRTLLFAEREEILSAMQAYADQEKRKEAIGFFNSVTDDGCNNYFKIGDSWFLGEDENDEDPEGPFTSEQLYETYLLHLQNSK